MHRRIRSEGWSRFERNLLFISKDNFLRGDNSRKVQHQQQRKPRKKTKPPALTKKHKKKRRRGPRRPQKPIPPAVPQGNLSMPTSVSLPVEASQIRSVGQWGRFPLCGDHSPALWLSQTDLAVAGQLCSTHPSVSSDAEIENVIVYSQGFSVLTEIIHSIIEVLRNMF